MSSGRLTKMARQASLENMHTRLFCFPPCRRHNRITSSAPGWGTIKKQAFFERGKSKATHAWMNPFPEKPRNSFFPTKLIYGPHRFGLGPRARNKLKNLATEPPLPPPPNNFAQLFMLRVFGFNPSEGATNCAKRKSPRFLKKFKKNKKNKKKFNKPTP